MPHRDIPPEVLDVIVALVAIPLRLDSNAERDEVELTKKTVASCALVSRQWRDIAQEHQYHDLVVQFRDLETSRIGRTLARFTSFVAGSSRLSAAVRALQLRRSRKYEERPGGPFARHQTFNTHHLLDLIIHFKRLQQLYISFSTVDLPEEDDTATLHNYRLESLTQFICRPAVRFGCIVQDHGALHGLLAPFVNAREITLRGLSFLTSAVARPVRQMHFNSLTRVTMRKCTRISSILKLLQTAAQAGLPALEWLEASYVELSELPELRSLLATLGSRLKHFGVGFDELRYEDEPHYLELHLAACPNLRSFEFTPEHTSDAHPWDLYLLLSHILEEMLDAAPDPRTLALGSVTVVCQSLPMYDGMDVYTLAPASMTALQDATLRFPTMRRLEFKLSTTEDGTFERFIAEDSERVHFAGLMSKLDEKGILVF